ncbi:MAG: EpsG family protein [Oscillospiraceae bacterium]
MYVYIMMLAVSVAAGIPLCSSKCGKWGRAVYCILGAVAFTVISAMRFQVSYDYNLYGAMYSEMTYNDLADISAMKMEKGFLIPLYALSLGFSEYYYIFIYTSVIIYPAVFALIYKYSSSPWISVTAFLCFGSFFNSLCFLRQFMAALIITYAIKYVSSKNPARFFVLTLAASAFHWSALVMLVMYFLLKIKPGYIYLGITAVLTIVFCIFSKDMMMWFIDHFYMYRGYNPETSTEASVGLSPRYTVIFGIIFIVCFIFRKQLIEKNPDNAIYINCMMFDVVFEAMGMRHAILSRFALLVLLPPIFYLIPDTVQVIKEYVTEKISGVRKRTAAAVLSVTASSVFAVAVYFILIVNNYNGVYPYVAYSNRTHDIFVEEKSEELDAEDEDEEWYDEDEEWYDEDEEWYDEDEEWYDEDEEYSEEDIYIDPEDVEW